MESNSVVEVPARLSRAKQSLIEKRLRAAFKRNGCSWSSNGHHHARNGSAVVPLQTRGSKPPLIIVHGAGGGLLWGYKNLAAQLGPDQPIYAIEPRSISNWQSLRSVEEMALAYLEHLRSFQEHGPYYIGGYCFGGLIAYEIARQLWVRCERVGAVVLIDAAAPNGIYQQLPWWRPHFLCNFARNCLYWLQDFGRLEPAARRNFLRRKVAVGCRKLVRRFNHGGQPPDRLDLEEFIDPAQFPEDELELWKVHLQAELNYRPKPYPGHIILVRTRGEPIFCSFDPKLGWGQLVAGGITVKMVPGAHERIFEMPNVPSLGQTLRGCLSGVTQTVATL